MRRGEETDCTDCSGALAMPPGGERLSSPAGAARGPRGWGGRETVGSPAAREAPAFPRSWRRRRLLQFKPKVTWFDPRTLPRSNRAPVGRPSGSTRPSSSSSSPRTRARSCSSPGRLGSGSAGATTPSGSCCFSPQRDARVRLLLDGDAQASPTTTTVPLLCPTPAQEEARRSGTGRPRRAWRDVFFF